MGKIERRKKLYQKHINKQKLIQETSGKLIEENHNGQDYSVNYVQKFISWRFFELWMKVRKFKDNQDRFWLYFSKLRQQFQTLLLRWPDSKLSRGEEFWFIYDLLNIYRKGEKEKLYNKCLNYLK